MPQIQKKRKKAPPSKKFLKLRAKIIEKGYCLKEVAILTGISLSTFSAKINGKREFAHVEMVRLIKVLGISVEEAAPIFFQEAYQL